MIDPHNITNYDRNDKELQQFWLFCIMVAGKKAEQTAKKVNQLTGPYYGPLRALASVGEGTLMWHLKHYKIGQYKRISRAIQESQGLNLYNATLDDLLKIHGVGPKTARFFLVHSRRNQEYAILDTHILRWMKQELGPRVIIPKNTPQNLKTYKELEDLYFHLVHEKFPFANLADVDLELWKTTRKKESV